MDDQGSVPSRVKDFSLLHSVQTGSGGHPASYTVGTWGGSFPGGKSGRSVNLTTHLNLMLRSRIRGSIHPLPHISSWCGA
jgi:hypothetical protein